MSSISLIKLPMLGLFKLGCDDNLCQSSHSKTGPDPSLFRVVLVLESV